MGRSQCRAGRSPPVTTGQEALAPFVKSSKETPSYGQCGGSHPRGPLSLGRHPSSVSLCFGPITGNRARKSLLDTRQPPVACLGRTPAPISGSPASTISGKGWAAPSFLHSAASSKSQNPGRRSPGSRLPAARPAWLSVMPPRPGAQALWVQGSLKPGSGQGVQPGRLETARPGYLPRGQCQDGTP